MAPKSQHQITARIPEFQELFKRLRELLFSCSQDLARTGGANWERAEALFKLAKSTEQLRNSVVSVLSDDSGVTAQHSDSVPELSFLAARKGSARSQKQGYPKYRVKGDLLVKTGLSRTARKEYEHTLPKKDFDAMILLLSEFSSSKRDFSIEEVQSRLHFPNYQIYTVLSLLKARDILFVPKRGLYSFRTPRAFPAEAQNLWEALRTHE